MFPVTKRFISRAAQSGVFEKMITAMEHLDGRRSGLLRVLTYHRVDEAGARPWLDPGLISATPEAFRQQLDYLVTHYHPVHLEEVIAAVETPGSKSLPARAVLVTFDDAYSDFKEYAWPVLRHYGIPVTLFVPTAYPDHPERTFWWDDLYQAVQNTHREDQLKTPIGLLSLSKDSRNQTYKRLKNYLKTQMHADAVATVKGLCQETGIQPAENCILGWDSLRKLADEGVSMGAHTRTHPLMNRISLDEAREQAVGSLQDLEREMGTVLPVFAYPGGEFNDETVAMLNSAGFKMAFTTKRGINDINHTHPLKISRINVGGTTPLSLLRAQLLPWTVHFNKLQTYTHA